MEIRVCGRDEAKRKFESNQALRTHSTAVKRNSTHSIPVASGRKVSELGSLCHTRTQVYLTPRDANTRSTTKGCIQTQLVRIRASRKWFAVASALHPPNRGPNYQGGLLTRARSVPSSTPQH